MTASSLKTRGVRAFAILLVLGSTVATSNLVWGASVQTMGSPHFTNPESGTSAVWDPELKRAWIFGGDWYNGTLDQDIYWFSPEFGIGTLPGAHPANGPVNEVVSSSFSPNPFIFLPSAPWATIDAAPVLPKYPATNGHSGVLYPQLPDGNPGDTPGQIEAAPYCGNGFWSGSFARWNAGGRTDTGAAFADGKSWIIGGRGHGCYGGATSKTSGAECKDPRDDRYYLDDIAWFNASAPNYQPQKITGFALDSSGVPLTLPTPRSDVMVAQDTKGIMILGGQEQHVTHIPAVDTSGRGVVLDRPDCPDWNGRRGDVVDEVLNLKDTVTFGSPDIHSLALTSIGTLPYPVAEASSVYFAPTQTTYIFGGTHLPIASKITVPFHSQVVRVAGASPDKDCFYYHHGPWNAVIVGDMRLNDCPAGSLQTAQTQVNVGDTDAGATISATYDAPAFSYKDNDGNGAYSAGDALYMSDVLSPTVQPTTATAFTLRLANAPGALTVATLVLTGDADAASPVLSVAPFGLHWIDADATGTLTGGDSLFAGPPMTTSRTVPVLSVRLGGTGSLYGHQVLSTDIGGSNIDATLVPNQAVFLYVDNGGVGKDCVYYHAGLGLTLHAGDLRLTPCGTASAGTDLTYADTTELGATAIPITDARLASTTAYNMVPSPLTPPNPAPGNVGPLGVNMYLVRGTATGAIPLWTGPSSWALRLTGGATAGKFVVTGDSDATAVLRAPTNGASFRYFDADYTDTYTAGDSMYVGAALPAQRLALLRNDNRLSGPYGAFGDQVNGNSLDSTSVNYGPASSEIMGFKRTFRSTILPAHLPSARNNTVAVTDGSRYIYILGGEEGQGDTLDQIVRFEPLTGEVVKMDLRLPATRREASGVYVGDCDIYLFGGARDAQREPFAASPSPTTNYPKIDQRHPILDEGGPFGLNFTDSYDSIVHVRVCGFDVTNIADQQLFVGQPSRVCISVSDSSSPLRFFVTPMPPNGYLTEDHCIVWTPTEMERGLEFSVTVTVQGDGDGDTFRFKYSVNKYGAWDAHDADSDRDGVNDWVDNCPGVPNQLQEDADSNAVGDACQKYLKLGAAGNSVGPGGASPGDYDHDGVADIADNCQLQANADQGDMDHDLIGDVCDRDMDGDLINDKAASGDNAAFLDNCPTVPNQFQEDSDRDNVGDLCEGLTSGGTSNGAAGSTGVPASTGEVQGTPDVVDKTPMYAAVIGGVVLMLLVAGLLVLFVLRRKGPPT